MLVRRVLLSTTSIMITTVALIALLLFSALITEAGESDVTRQSAAAEDFQFSSRTMAAYMSDMETGLRGYVLTGQDDFLQPYNNAKASLPPVWNDLARRAQEIEAGSTETLTVAILIDTKNAADAWQGEFAEPVIAERRADGVAGIISSTLALQSETGKKLFDTFRADTVRMDTHVRVHVVAYAAAVNRASTTRLGLLLGLSVLALGNAIFAVRLIRRDERSQAEVISRSEADRERLQTLIENLPVAVRLVSAPLGDIVLQNRLSAEITPTEEWNKLPVDERTTHFYLGLPDGQPMTPVELPSLRSIREGVTITDFEVIRHVPGSVPRTLLSSSAPLRDSHGGIVGAVLVIQDVTKAKELDQRKDEFIATAAHELRNPLTALLGHYQLLMKMWPDLEAPPGAKRHLDGMGKQLRRMNALIEHLLDASRIELGRLVLARTKFNLVSLARSTVVDAQTADNDEHVISFASNEDSITGTWDETRVSQAMSNLLSNAARYSPPGSEITLRLRTEPGKVQVAVIDQGPGVPEELRPALFDRYYQAEQPAGSPPTVPHPHDPPRPSTKGLGLGLYITAEIVKAHGGDIGVEPNPQGGSIFWFTLPRS